jgi:hypothetical protein
MRRRAALAQSAERFTRNEQVVGSIPTGGSTLTSGNAGFKILDHVSPVCGMPASARMSAHSCQSARESIGRPFSWHQTRSWSSHDVRRGQALAGLRRPVLPEHGDELRRERDRLAAAFLDLAEHQAAAAALRALRRVPLAARLAQQGRTGRDAHVAPADLRAAFGQLRGQGRRCQRAAHFSASARRRARRQRRVLPRKGQPGARRAAPERARRPTRLTPGAGRGTAQRRLPGFDRPAHGGRVSTACRHCLPGPRSCC